MLKNFFKKDVRTADFSPFSHCTPSFRLFGLISAFSLATISVQALEITLNGEAVPRIANTPICEEPAIDFFAGLEKSPNYKVITDFTENGRNPHAGDLITLKSGVHHYTFFYDGSETLNLIQPKALPQDYKIYFESKKDDSEWGGGWGGSDNVLQNQLILIEKNGHSFPFALRFKKDLDALKHATKSVPAIDGSQLRSLELWHQGLNALEHLDKLNAKMCHLFLNNLQPNRDKVAALPKEAKYLTYQISAHVKANEFMASMEQLDHLKELNFLHIQSPHGTRFLEIARNNPKLEILQIIGNQTLNPQESAPLPKALTELTILEKLPTLRHAVFQSPQFLNLPAKSFPNLQSLNLINTSVTTAAFDAFKAKNPQCYLVRDYQSSLNEALKQTVRLRVIDMPHQMPEKLILDTQNSATIKRVKDALRVDSQHGDMNQVYYLFARLEFELANGKLEQIYLNRDGILWFKGYWNYCQGKQVATLLTQVADQANLKGKVPVGDPTLGRNILRLIETIKQKQEDQLVYQVIEQLNDDTYVAENLKAAAKEVSTYEIPKIVALGAKYPSFCKLLRYAFYQYADSMKAIHLGNGAINLYNDAWFEQGEQSVQFARNYLKTADFDKILDELRPIYWVRYKHRLATEFYLPEAPQTETPYYHLFMFLLSHQEQHAFLNANLHNLPDYIRPGAEIRLNLAITEHRLTETQSEHLVSTYGQIAFGLETFISGNKWGIRDLQKKTIIPSQYQAIRLIGPNRFLVKANDKWRLINRHKQHLNNTDYEYINDKALRHAYCRTWPSPFFDPAETTALVKCEAGYFLLTPDQDVALPAIDHGAYKVAINETRFIVSVTGQGDGLANEKGDWLIAPQKQLMYGDDKLIRLWNKPYDLDVAAELAQGRDGWTQPIEPAYQINGKPTPTTLYEFQQQLRPEQTINNWAVFQLNDRNYQLVNINGETSYIPSADYLHLIPQGIVVGYRSTYGSHMTYGLLSFDQQEWLLDPKYVTLGSSGEGVATSTERSPGYYAMLPSTILSFEYYDKALKRLTAFKSANSYRAPKHGVHTFHTRDFLWGLCDLEGKILINPIYPNEPKIYGPNRLACPLKDKSQWLLLDFHGQPL